MKTKKTEDAGKANQTKLRPQQWNGRTYIGVDLPWRERVEIIAQQNRFFDQVLAMAELPEHHEWPEILAVSQRYGIQSIWNRVRPSPLESNAAALLTGLAFTNHKEWVQLVRTFFKAHNLTPSSLRGRPRLHPRDVKDMTRGLQIGKLIEQLEEGFEVKLSAKKGGGFASDDEQVAKELKTHGYGDKEVKATLKGKTLQDAGCRLYLAVSCETDATVALHTIRNSYARYKSLPEANPPTRRRSSKFGEDSQ